MTHLIVQALLARISELWEENRRLLKVSIGERFKVKIVQEALTKIWLGHLAGVICLDQHYKMCASVKLACHVLTH
jgi:hypothetical protein